MKRLVGVVELTTLALTNKSEGTDIEPTQTELKKFDTYSEISISIVVISSIGSIPNFICLSDDCSILMQSLLFRVLLAFMSMFSFVLSMPTMILRI